MADDTTASESIRVVGLRSEEISDRLLVAARTVGCSVVATGSGGLHVTRGGHAPWVVPAAVVLGLASLGLGFLLLLVRRNQSVTVLVDGDGDGATVTLRGDLSSDVAGALRAALGAASSVLPAAPPSLLVSDGQAVQVTTGGVIGRNPMDDPDIPGGQRVVVDDPSLSKTHLSFRPGPGGLTVRDRASAAGSRAMVDGTARECPPHVWVPIPSGSTIYLGDVSVHVVAA